MTDFIDIPGCVALHFYFQVQSDGSVISAGSGSIPEPYRPVMERIHPLVAAYLDARTYPPTPRGGRRMLADLAGVWFRHLEAAGLPFVQVTADFDLHPPPE